MLIQQSLAKMEGVGLLNARPQTSTIDFYQGSHFDMK